MSEVNILTLRMGNHATMPAYAFPGDAGADLAAAQDAIVPPANGRAEVMMSLALAIPDGHFGLICPRSGIASRHGVTILNAPGIVDSGYRGEIVVVLLNTDPIREFRIATGDRVAQLVIVPFARARFTPSDELPESARGTSGQGSTDSQPSSDT